MKEALLARGLPEPLLVEAGLLIKPEDGGASYDRFRNRVMFPIGDRRGRIIAFGGRALDADAPAKYLNSPETRSEERSVGKKCVSQGRSRWSQYYSKKKIKKNKSKI